MLEQPSYSGQTGRTVASGVRKLLKLEVLCDDGKDLDSLEGNPGCTTDVLHMLVVNS